MVIGTALGWSDLATIALAVGLAFFVGYALTIRPVLRSGLPLRAAIPVALIADAVSITVMLLAVAMAVTFVVTIPVNRALIARSRSRGHAVLHQHHH